MYHHIKGALVHLLPNMAVIEAGGIGYQMNISLVTYDSISGKSGQEVCLLQYLCVREDELTLYGFSRTEERDLFQKLITVSGIGPKKALEIFNHGSPELFAEAIMKSDPLPFKKVKGIGDKQAQKIVLELSGKIKLESKLKSDSMGDVYEGLKALGFSDGEIEKGVGRYREKGETIADFDTLFRTILGYCSKY